MGNVYQNFIFPNFYKLYDKGNIALYTMFIDFEHYKHLITKFS